uniref:Uncharacterized protein n=1 Tax=Solanum tuberosum TaxID=4113 RepID=M1BJU0_SOLTU
MSTICILCDAELKIKKMEISRIHVIFGSSTSHNTRKCLPKPRTKGGGGDYVMIKPFLHLQFVQEVLQSHGCMQVWSLNQLPGMQSINTF